MYNSMCNTHTHYTLHTSHSTHTTCPHALHTLHTPHTQKAMKLEDVSELEVRELKDKLSQLSQDNRNYVSKFKGQKEHSKLEVHISNFRSFIVNFCEISISVLVVFVWVAFNVHVNFANFFWVSKKNYKKFVIISILPQNLSKYY